MSKTVKILLVALLAGLLTVGGCIGAIYAWIVANQDELKTRGEEMTAQAKAYAAEHDQNECISEALRRSRNCDGVICEAMTGVFLRACLDEAKTVSTLCDGVPSESAIAASVSWRLRQCASSDDPQRCGRVLSAWQQHCRERD